MKAHTCLPDATHRAQGRFTSQLRWARLQLIHAEATCAFDLRPPLELVGRVVDSFSAEDCHAVGAEEVGCD